MLSAEAKGYTMSAGTTGQGEEDLGMGIISGHAYTLIGAYDVMDANFEPESLVKLRNPWG